MKNSVGKGAFLLIVSGFICKIIGAFFRLPLTNILGIEGIGIFQMVMSLYSLSLVLVTGGVTSSLSKLVSDARAKRDFCKINGYFRTALLFSAGLSLILGIMFAIFSGQISSLQGASGGKYSYMLLSFLLPMGALIGVYRGIIQGYENMAPTAISQIIEQSIKLCLGLFFAKVLVENNIASGVFGAFLGITASEVLAFIFLAITLLSKYKTKAIKSNVDGDFLKAVLPLSIGSAIIPFTHAFDSLFVVSLLTLAGFSSSQATTLYGLQTGVVGALLNFPLIISLSIGVSLLPKLSYLSAQKDIQKQRDIINKSFSVFWVFILPLVVGIMSISYMIYPIIYPKFIGDYLNYAVSLTYLGGIVTILTAVMQFLISILQAKGYYFFTMVSTVFGSLIKIFLVVTLTRQSNINIFAISLSNIFLATTVCVFAIIKLKNLLKVSLFDFILPILSSLIMFLIVRMCLNIFSNVWGLIFAIFLGAVIYILLVLPMLLNFIKSIFKKDKEKII